MQTPTKLSDSFPADLYQVRRYSVWLYILLFVLWSLQVLCFRLYKSLPRVPLLLHHFSFPHPLAFIHGLIWEHLLSSCSSYRERQSYKWQSVWFPAPQASKGPLSWSRSLFPGAAGLHASPTTLCRIDATHLFTFISKSDPLESLF